MCLVCYRYVMVGVVRYVGVIRAMTFGCGSKCCRSAVLVYWFDVDLRVKAGWRTCVVCKHLGRETSYWSQIGVSNRELITRRCHSARANAGGGG